MRIQDNTLAQANYTRQKTTRKAQSETANSSPGESEKTRAAAVGTEDDPVIKDTVEISSAEAEKSGDTTGKAGDIADELQKMADELKWFKEQMEIARTQSEGAAEQWRVLIKCIRIAMRIISGDIVPKEDHRYLAKHDPKLYAKALTMRIPKDNPKKYKRLSKDEKQKKDAKVDNKENVAPGVSKNGADAADEPEEEMDDA